MTDDNLEKSSERLGVRFSDVGGEEDSPSESPDNTEPSSSADPDYHPTTIYLPKETRKEFRRFLKRLTLDYPEMEEAEKRELHTAFIEAAMNQSEHFIEQMEENVNEQ